LSVLKLENIHASYGRSEALKGVSLEVNQSEIVAIIGPNGSGKTTTLRVIFGLLPATEGAVTIAGRSISGEPPHHRARQGVAFGPEGGRVFTKLSVRENLELGAYVRKDKAEILDDLAFVEGIFPRLAERRRSAAGTLSGGERQMLSIGRCLMLRPSLLMLDEPSLGLAPLVVEEIYSKIELIRRRRNVTILLVEQNAKKALEVADRGYVLTLGRVALSGSGAQLLADEEVQQTFLGG
jgi:branched-chain amino acid transport system ATP-binding protein